MKKIFILLFVYAFALTACGQENTVAYEDTNNSSYSSVKKVEVAKADFITFNKKFKNKANIISLQKTKLKEGEFEILTGFVYKNKVYWSILDIIEDKEIVFFMNKDISNIHTTDMKNIGPYAYEYYVKKGDLDF